jgi:hypothetical protein
VVLQREERKGVAKGATGRRGRGRTEGRRARREGRGELKEEGKSRKEWRKEGHEARKSKKDQRREVKKVGTKEGRKGKERTGEERTGEEGHKMRNGGGQQGKQGTRRALRRGCFCGGRNGMGEKGESERTSQKAKKRCVAGRGCSRREGAVAGSGLVF